MMHVPLARIMEVQRYLDRLGVAVTGGPSLGELRSLHEGHLLNVPFENLDIHRGVEIVLDDEKILEERFGIVMPGSVKGAIASSAELE